MRDQDNGNALVNSGQTINKTTIAGGIEFKHHFLITNTSATTNTYIIRKYEDLINTITPTDKASAYFCSNTTCYSASTFTAAKILNAGESFTLIPSLDEASALGESTVRYKVVNQLVGSDFMYVVLDYNAFTFVNKNIKESAFISDIYPNPAAKIPYIDVFLEDMPTNSLLKTYGQTGELIEVKALNLALGTNTISLSEKELPEGVYFAVISMDGNSAVRKFLITK